jgi:hypothetical protein
MNHVKQISSRVGPIENKKAYINVSIASLPRSIARKIPPVLLMNGISTNE